MKEGRLFISFIFIWLHWQCVTCPIVFECTAQSTWSHVGVPSPQQPIRGYAHYTVGSEAKQCSSCLYWSQLKKRGQLFVKRRTKNRRKTQSLPERRKRVGALTNQSWVTERGREVTSANHLPFMCRATVKSGVSVLRLDTHRATVRFFGGRRKGLRIGMNFWS